jgi:DNA repair exonuclease SbcCD ATPase subunit
MIFKWMKAKNFLSIGSSGIHVAFDNLGNIVVVKGKNLDVSPESSNGAGKSTLIECLVYGLFGKLIKGLPHKEAINKKTKKGLQIELCFELDEREYRILRKRKPDDLEFWKDGVKDTLGGMPETQKGIEAAIKLNYESFINIVCFGEHNNHAFLACNAETKRSIVENLLGLEKYLKYCKIAKDSLKEIETKLTVLKKKYETAVEQRDGAIARIAQLVAKQKAWIAAKEKELEQLNLALSNKAQELNKTDDGAASLLYVQAQERIKAAKDEMVKLEEKRVEISTLLEQIRAKQEKLQESKNSAALSLQTKNHEASTKDAEIRVIEGQIKALTNLTPGVKCSACFGTVDKANYQHLLDHNNTLLAGLKEAKATIDTDKASLAEKLKDATAQLTKMLEMKKSVEEKNTIITNKLSALLGAIQRDSLVKEPQVGAKELLLKEQMAELTKRIESKKLELDTQDPYLDIIKQTTVEKTKLDEKISELKTEMDAGDALVPYYEFWIDGFGDDGIRAFIIDGILPALNARINYWLQFLIDNKITLAFDNKFEVTIERNPPDGDPFVYNATSGGERRRINLAISQAFAHVMMISAGTCPSIISLDEVALNVDVPGVHGIYKMICELAKDRQVFVTTHDPNLNDLLKSCDTLTVIKKDGFTELEVLKVAA